MTNFANPLSPRPNQRALSYKAPEPKRSTLASDSANSLWQAYKSSISPFPATGKDFEKSKSKSVKNLLVNCVLTYLSECVKGRIIGYSSGTAVWNVLERAIADSAMTRIIDHKNTKEPKWQSLTKVVLIGMYASVTEGVKSWIGMNPFTSALWNSIERGMSIWNALNQSSTEIDENQQPFEFKGTHNNHQTLMKTESISLGSRQKRHNSRRGKRPRNRHGCQGRTNNHNITNPTTTITHAPIINISMNHGNRSRKHPRVDDTIPDMPNHTKRTRNTNNAVVPSGKAHHRVQHFKKKKDSSSALSQKENNEVKSMAPGVEVTRKVGVEDKFVQAQLSHRHLRLCIFSIFALIICFKVLLSDHILVSFK